MRARKFLKNVAGSQILTLRGSENQMSKSQSTECDDNVGIQ